MNTKKRLISIGMIIFIFLISAGNIGFTDSNRIPVARVNGREIYFNEDDEINLYFHIQSMSDSVNREQFEEKDGNFLLEARNLSKPGYDRILHQAIYRNLLKEHEEEDILNMESEEKLYESLDEFIGKRAKKLGYSLDDFKRDTKGRMDIYHYSAEIFKNKADAEAFIKAYEEVHKSQAYKDLPKENEPNTFLSHYNSSRFNLLLKNKLSDHYSNSEDELGGVIAPISLELSNTLSFEDNNSFIMENIVNMQPGELSKPIRYYQDKEESYYVFKVDEIQKEASLDDETYRSIYTQKLLLDHKDELFDRADIEIYKSDKIIEAYLNGGYDKIAGTVNGRNIYLNYDDIISLRFEKESASPKEYDRFFDDLIKEKVNKILIQENGGQEFLDQKTKVSDEELETFLKSGEFGLLKFAKFKYIDEDTLDETYNFLNRDNNGYRIASLMNKVGYDEELQDWNYELTSEDKKLLDSLSMDRQVLYFGVDEIFKYPPIEGSQIKSDLESKETWEQGMKLDSKEISKPFKSDGMWTSIIKIASEEDMDIIRNEARIILKKDKTNKLMNKLYEEADIELKTLIL